MGKDNICTGVPVSRRKFLGSTALASAGLVAGCAGGGGSSGENEFTFTTGPSDSTAFGMANALSSLLEENSDLTMNVQSGTSSESVALLAAGSTDLAYATTLVGDRARNREGDFADVEFNRTILQLPSYYWIRVALVALLDTDLQTHTDIAGVPVGPGPSGASYWAPMEEALLKELDESDLDYRTSGPGEYANLLSSGDVQAAGGPVYINGIVPSFMQQVYSQTDVRLLGWSDDMIQRIQDDPVVPGRYVSNDQLGDIAEFAMEDETFMVSANYVMYTSEEMSEETIYNMYSTIYENRQSLVDASAAFELWQDAEFFSANMTTAIPVHPGAERFLKEVGAWNDEFETADI